MRLFAEDYDGGTIVSVVSLSDEYTERCRTNAKNVLHVSAPTEAVLHVNSSEIEIHQLRGKTNELCEGDIAILHRDRVIEIAYGCEIDFALVVTGNCNSDCVMCPSSFASRTRYIGHDIKTLMTLVDYLPSDLPHCTITGGEPLLLGNDFFVLLEKCKQKLPNTKFLLLTNGRLFCRKHIAQQLWETAPRDIVIAIPVHGADAELHDGITQAIGSFEQTMTGIRNLASLGFALEIRIVLCRLNIDAAKYIARLIVALNAPNLRVHFIALEMTGSAAVNADSLWIPYSEAFERIQELVKFLIANGVDVRLYNFPLCAVSDGYHSICANSISPEKIRKSGSECEKCCLNESCGGIFKGSARFAEKELKAFT